MSKAFDKWTAAYRRMSEQGVDLMWPSETLVRLFKGDYVKGLDRNFEGKKALDIGCGNGNNSIFLATLGLSIHGTEVSDDICEKTASKLAELGYDFDLRVGTNRSLPFPDDGFDFLVSWNVVHYEDSEQRIREAIAEYEAWFEKGFVRHSTTAAPTLEVYEQGREGPVEGKPGTWDAYQEELSYFLGCIRTETAPETCTPASSRDALCAALSCVTSAREQRTVLREEIL